MMHGTRSPLRSEADIACSNHVGPTMFLVSSNDFFAFLGASSVNHSESWIMLWNGNDGGAYAPFLRAWS
jgi:hypothetical protein